MRELQLKTNEPIKIYLLISEHGNDHTVEIKYKGKRYAYAYMSQVKTETIDLNELTTWVNETYYDLSFLSSQYVPCELKAENFSVNN